MRIEVLAKKTTCREKVENLGGRFSTFSQAKTLGEEGVVVGKGKRMKKRH